MRRGLKKPMGIIELFSYFWGVTTDDLSLILDARTQSDYLSRILQNVFVSIVEP